MRRSRVAVSGAAAAENIDQSMNKDRTSQWICGNVPRDVLPDRVYELLSLLSGIPNVDPAKCLVCYSLSGKLLN